jgi:putative SOS response-associated peptidase YedK
MCGRFTQHCTWGEVHDFLSVFGALRNLQPRYNIAPTTSVDVVRLDPEGRRELVSMRWGLVPFFWKKGLRGASHLQRAGGNARRQANVPRDAAAPPLPEPFCARARDI